MLLSSLLCAILSSSNDPVIYHKLLRFLLVLCGVFVFLLVLIHCVCPIDKVGYVGMEYLFWIGTCLLCIAVVRVGKGV